MKLEYQCIHKSCSHLRRGACSGYVLQEADILETILEFCLLHSTAHVFLPPEFLYTRTHISAQMPVERDLQTEVPMASQNKEPNSSCLSSVL